MLFSRKSLVLGAGMLTSLFAASSHAFFMKRAIGAGDLAAGRPAKAKAIAPAVNGPTKLILVDDMGMFQLSQEAREVFQTLEGPIYMVVLHGKARQGKSTLLSLFVKEWYRNSPHEVQASSFKFETRDGFISHTKGQWFTALRWNDNGHFKGTILLVDSEGTGDGKRADEARAAADEGEDGELGEDGEPKRKAVGIFDAKLWAVARMESQVLMVRPMGLVSDSEQAHFLKDYNEQHGKALELLPQDVQDDVRATKVMMVLKDMKGDDKEAGRGSRAELRNQCSDDMKQMVPDPLDFFLFGPPLNVPADEQEDDKLVIDYHYPTQFSNRTFIPVLQRLIRRIKDTLDNSKPLVRDATQLEDKLYSIYAVPNCAEAGKAFPTPKTFEEYRKQIEEEKLAKEVARKRKEIAEGERDVAKVAEADANKRAKRAEEEQKSIQEKMDKMQENQVFQMVVGSIDAVCNVVGTGAKLKKACSSGAKAAKDLSKVVDAGAKAAKAADAGAKAAKAADVGGSLSKMAGMKFGGAF